jgi:hypothetical protein
MIVTPFIPGHLDALIARIDAKLGIVTGGKDYGRQLFVPGLAYTALGEDGHILGSGGIAPIHDGVGDAWALFSVKQEPGASRTWVQIDRAVRLFLHSHLGKDFRRIQTVVKTDFEHGHKWARRLGFSDPQTMRKWGPDGADYDLYSMVK